MKPATAANTPQPAAANTPPAAGAPPAAQAGLATPGRPLDPAARAFLEPRLGHDFSRVRIHAGGEAAPAARAVQARAYTVGRDIVFAAGEYAPETPAGRELLAHELVHVAQQGAAPARTGAPALRSGVRMQRAPDATAPSQFQDPISLAATPGFGFYLIGPEFTGPPHEADVRQVLAETGVADAKLLGESTPASYKAAHGDITYFAYVHPTLGVVARGYAASTDPTSKNAAYGVYAFIADADAKKYRPPGGTGEKRRPIPSLEAMTGTPPARFTDLYAGLRLVETRLQAFAAKYPPGPPGQTLGRAIAKAQADAAAWRAAASATPEQLKAIETALQLLEWVEYDFSLLDQQRTKLVASGAPTRSLTLLRGRYRIVFEELFQADAVASYEEVQRWDERFQVDVLLDTLTDRGELNQGVLDASDKLLAWVDDLRGRLDAFGAQRKLLAATPGDAALAKQVQTEAAFLNAAALGIELYGEWVVAHERFLAGYPGFQDLQIVNAMNNVATRVNAIKDAYYRHDAADLQARATKLANDEDTKQFLREVPGMLQVTKFIAKIGVTTAIAVASGGVGGLVTGGADTAATGLTLRSALTFAGTASLEAATFTGLNAAASTVLFGEKAPSFGSLLKDFAWNLGMFSVLHAVAGVSTGLLRAAELQALNLPVQLAVGYPLTQGLGILRFRVEQDRWPTKGELDQMTAESILLLAGILVGSRGVQRYIEAGKRAGSLTLFYREYGWRFDALDSLRNELGANLEQAEAAGKGNDPAALADAKTRATTLEQEIQNLLKTILEDKRFDVAKIREELNSLRQTVPDAAAEILSRTLNLPDDIVIRRAGRASYTYASGKTSALKAALAGAYDVTQTAEPISGLNTVTAKSRAGGPDLIFQERTAGAVDLDTGVFDIQKLLLDFQLTSAGAQRMLWRLLSENGIAKDPRQATILTRRQVRDLVARSGQSADETLSNLQRTGRLRSAAPKAVVAAADRLQQSGILTSTEWLEARGLDNQRGVVGEWLAKESVAPPSGTRVFRRVTVQADLFEDAAATVPAKDADGRARLNVTAAETDLVYGRDVSGNVEVDTVVNVKASGEKGMAKSAAAQNANFEALLRAQPGDLVPVRLADGVRYARIKAITALEGTAEVDLTGKLKPAAGLSLQSVGPKGAGGFSRTVALDKGGISAVTGVLNETQLIGAGEY